MDEVPEIDVTALHGRLHSGPPIQIIDVREDWEWAQGHIADATHIPLGELTARLGELDRSREVAFICQLGGRSEMATRFARAHGYGHAVNVAGGMDAWEGRQLPVTSG